MSDEQPIITEARQYEKGIFETLLDSHRRLLETLELTILRIERIEAKLHEQEEGHADE